MIVTIWERLNGNKWEHNHYEAGYDPSRTTPTPLHDNHVRAWASSKWRSIKGEIVNGLLTALQDSGESPHA
jgi:hypothetical protein